MGILNLTPDSFSDGGRLATPEVALEQAEALLAAAKAGQQLTAPAQLTDPAAPFAGGTTTFDALWMGVPVVSHAGERASSRGGLSILATLGRPEWVGANPEEMIAIARRLASDPRELAAIRSGLRDALRASPLDRKSVV